MAALLSLAGCGRSDAPVGAWTEMATRQVGVRLRPGVTSVEIRDAVDGWTERVDVESDGRTVTAGIPETRLRLVVGEAEAGGDRAFFTAVTDGVAASGATLDRAYALCLWVGRRAYVDGVPRRDTMATKADEPATAPDGRDVLARIDSGYQVGCLSLATVFVDAARARGIAARRVDLAVRDGSPYEGHSVAEIRSTELEKWVLVDPTYGVYYTVDGVPSDALEVQAAVFGGRGTLAVVRQEGAQALDPWESVVDPLLYFRNVYHIFADGTWVRYAGPGTPPAIVARYAQTDSAALLDLPPGFDAEVPARVGRVRGRLVYQALDGTLYVCLDEGRFEPRRFFVRATPGAHVTFTQEVAGYDPSDATLFAPEELAPNPTLADADGDGTPDEWTVECGAPRFEWTGDGALVVESGDEPCLLSCEAPLASKIPIAATLRVRVDRGHVAFYVRDSHPADRVEIGAGHSGAFSPILLQVNRRRARPRIELTPRTRCLISGMSIRRERRLADVVPR